MKVTRWRAADGEMRSRKDAWEVCIPVGNGQIDTILFSGPNAAGRSARYAEQHGYDLCCGATESGSEGTTLQHTEERRTDWREGVVQDEIDDDISDLLA